MICILDIKCKARQYYTPNQWLNTKTTPTHRLYCTYIYMYIYMYIHTYICMFHSVNLIKFIQNNDLFK